MDSAKLNDWLQVIGIFALVASLIFVGLQMKQTQEIGQGEATAYILESSNMFRNTVIDNAEVWRSGCMGEELSEGDQTRFAKMYNSYIATVYWLWLANDIGVIQFDAGTITGAFAASIHRYPGIAKISISKRQWGTEGSRIDLIGLERFTAAVQTRLAELREIEPEPVSNPDWCGNLS
jgi:hypothetical protein